MAEHVRVAPANHPQSLTPGSPILPPAGPFQHCPRTQARKNQYAPPRRGCDANPLYLRTRIQSRENSPRACASAGPRHTHVSPRPKINTPLTALSRRFDVSRGGGLPPPTYSWGRLLPARPSFLRC
ncbi:hypothetical protein Zmor_013062 [Zophobas morio]|uniref:Uncharacterized protein n=1 Tax=Zophobas morio TaxID=2755281 RepID=A0AA38ID46_9CUCU|nr:hypothetical protein Zmor_013062 [Zophobas morio]